jgi:membrane protease YdiL (CAAX protease family)
VIPYSASTAAMLIAGQSLLAVFAAGSAAILGTPNWGLGLNFQVDSPALLAGLAASVPLLAFAVVLEVAEAKLPAENFIKKLLTGVSQSTQSSILLILGPTFKPVAGFISALFMGLAAGIGEEWLFRGVCQPELITRVFGGSTMAGNAATSVVFGALHYATPLYSFLVALVSLFFGQLALNKSLVRSRIFSSNFGYRQPACSISCDFKEILLPPSHFFVPRVVPEFPHSGALGPLRVYSKNAKIKPKSLSGVPGNL